MYSEYIFDLKQKKEKRDKIIENLKNDRPEAKTERPEAETKRPEAENNLEELKPLKVLANPITFKLAQSLRDRAHEEADAKKYMDGPEYKFKVSL